MKKFEFFVFAIALLIFTASQLFGQKICTPSGSNYCPSYSSTNYNNGSGSSISAPYDYINLNLNYSIDFTSLPKSKFLDRPLLIMHTIGASMEFGRKDDIGWGLEYYMGFTQNTPNYIFKPGYNFGQVTGDDQWVGRINNFKVKRLGLISTKFKAFYVPRKKENNKYQDQIFAEFEIGGYRLKTKVEQGAFNSFKIIDDKTPGLFLGLNLGYRIKMVRGYVGVHRLNIHGSKGILFFRAGIGINLQFSMRSNKSVGSDVNSNYSSSRTYWPNLESPVLMPPKLRFSNVYFPRSNFPKLRFPKSNFPKSNSRKFSSPMSGSMKRISR